MKKTLTHYKAFLKANEGKLWIKHNSSFDGNTDCVMPNNDAGYKKIESSIDFENKNTLGVGGWLVGSSRDYFTEIENGFEVLNCCGSFQIITRD